MVVKNNIPRASAYTYGNVAYKIKPKEKEEKKKVVKNNRKHSKTRANIVLIIGIIFGFSMIVLYRYAFIIQANGNLRNTKSKINALQNENKNIIVEIAKTENIKDLEKFAIEKSGMVAPLYKDIVYMDVKPLNKIKDDKQIKVTNKINKFFGLIK